MKRNKDGTLKQMGRLPKESHTRRGSKEYNEAVLKETERLGRLLTEEERRLLLDKFTR